MPFNESCLFLHQLVQTKRLGIYSLVRELKQTQAMVECEICQRLLLFRVQDWTIRVYLHFGLTLGRLICSLDVHNGTVLETLSRSILQYSFDFSIPYNSTQC